MPGKAGKELSEKQRGLFGAELARRRAGKKARLPSLTTSQLEADLRRKKFKVTRKVSRTMRSFGDFEEKKKGVVIRVNPGKGGLIDTILHEELHRKFPKMGDKDIRKRAKAQEKKLSIPGAIRLLSKFK